MQRHFRIFQIIFERTACQTPRKMKSVCVPWDYGAEVQHGKFEIFFYKTEIESNLENGREMQIRFYKTIKSCLKF